MDGLEYHFVQLMSQYTEDHRLIGDLWTEISEAYGDPKRYYHTLDHLENMHDQLIRCKDLIQDFDTVLFSLYYHDIVYEASRSDNEAQSAALASGRLRSAGVPEEMIRISAGRILATKAHQPSHDPDTDLFTDADLAVLGADPGTYDKYCRDIRKEYAIYPDEVYKPGRKKALLHFLDMPAIFKTNFFRDRLEAQARSNIRREMHILDS